MDEVGFIIASDDEKATVEVRRISACGDKCGSCGGGCNVPKTRVEIENTLNVSPGEYVEIRMDTQKVLKAILMVYGIPLILMVTGIIIGIYIFNSEVLGLLTGGISLVVSYFLLRILDVYVKKGDMISFQMVRIVLIDELI